MVTVRCADFAGVACTFSRYDHNAPSFQSPRQDLAEQIFLSPFDPNAHLHEVTPTGTLMANHSAVPLHDEDDSRLEGAAIPELPASGPRKLVRPKLPADIKNRRSYARRETPLLIHQQAPASSARASSSHAEPFYLQKQMQSQTRMVFMLEDGDRLEGAIEWYDTDAIKVRNGNVRILIYKTAIKYLYKAADSQP
jgi:sRNA-binding regulator protein Hfq